MAKKSENLGNPNSNRDDSELQGYFNIVDMANNLGKTLNYVHHNPVMDAIGNLHSLTGIHSSNISPSSDKHITLISDINDLTKDVNNLKVKLKEAENDKDASEKIIKELIEKTEHLESKQKKNHILSRVISDIEDKILADESFYSQFKDGNECEAVVVSIDIRRSTELMLKARTPKLFSKFITQLSQYLSTCIISNYGVFDKFTGDGILAFFPKFYSGDQAILRALKAAEECHKIFDKHYNDSRSAFNVFIKDIGLGIGIDYGKVTLVNTSYELTVVGIPVVYACRMSGAKAGETLLNHSAMEELQNICPDKVKIIETEIDIKNEGTALAYIVDIHPSAFNNIALPTWKETKSEKKA